MNVLLIGAVAMIAALILSAWLMTFARWFPIKGIDGVFSRLHDHDKGPYRLHYLA